jgi:cation diffusion facilitator CzcD-associated flavoprotein CzcO
VLPNAVVASDGSVHEVDTIIFGTGFQVLDFPVSHRVRGADGATLAETWNGSPEAYLGTTHAGYPNLFTLTGPNTGLGHTSIIVMLESQFEHILRALDYMEQRDIAAVEPRREVQEEFVHEMDTRTQGTVWTGGGCNSWYIDETGRTPVLWPGFTFEFRRRLAQFEPSKYVLEPRRPVPGPREPAPVLA